MIIVSNDLFSINGKKKYKNLIIFFLWLRKIEIIAVIVLTSIVIVIVLGCRYVKRYGLKSQAIGKENTKKSG